MITNKIAVDTNVLIYLYSEDDIKKTAIADSILSKQPFIPAQVVSEYLNVTKRLLKIPKIDIFQKCNEVFGKGIIIPTTLLTLQKGASLVIKYDLQIFDAIIVASALQYNCNYLYSEDMQHGLVVENTLTIFNPFI